MNDCPKWSQEVPAAYARQFSALVRKVYARVAKDAATRIIDSQTPMRWHRALFRDFVPLDYYAGNFRQDDPARPCLGQDVQVGGESGTHYRYVIAEVCQLCESLRVELVNLELSWSLFAPPERARKFSTLLAALIGRFIRIHPFINGNGRTSRLLWAWGLLRFGVPIQCRIHPRPKPPYPEVMRQAMVGNYGPLALHILRHLAHLPPQTGMP
jgi:fido (protein-threonine AMPylation protein)